MKITIAQINTTPNDFQGNLAQIKEGIETAHKEQSDLLLFSELSIPGYLVKDLVYRDSFITDNLEGVQQVVGWSKIAPQLNVIVGYVDRNPTGTGKPARNMAAVIQNGLIRATYQKRLLPFYDVFDEGRYFEPGTLPCVFEVAGKKCGLSICEDIWCDKGQDDYNYPINPVQEYRDLGVPVLLNISSSPFNKGKIELRHKMLMEIFKSGFDVVAYANQVGGQDELVFDGNSAIVWKDPHGRTGVEDFFSFSSPPRPSTITVDTADPKTKNMKGQFYEWNTIEDLKNAITLGIRDYVQKSKFTDVVVGSSGGIDSALTIALACEALGAEHVHAIMMPTSISSEGSVVDAKALHAALGCREYTVPIDHSPLIAHITSSLPEPQRAGYNAVADENIQARLRGLTIMFYANAWGLLPLATGNKTELALGYCTLYGDMSGGFAPISDLYKDEVYRIAEVVNSRRHREIVPEAILNKAPSAELAPGQTDEASLLPYHLLNAIVKTYVEKYVDDFQTFTRWIEDNLLGDRATRIHYDTKESIKVWLAAEGSEKEYLEMVRKIDMAEFKRRQAAPGIKLSPVAFGSGRRLPIVQRTKAHSKTATNRTLLF